MRTVKKKELEKKGSHSSLLFFLSPNLYKAAPFASTFTSTHPSNHTPHLLEVTKDPPSQKNKQV